MKFYRCNKCGSIYCVIIDAAIVPKCCHECLEIMKPNTDESASKEKHIPVFKKIGNKLTVEVGETLHPSSNEHYIEWILIETNKGRYINYLSPSDKPSITFTLSCDEEEVINIYSYCNIHGLWAMA